MTRNVNRGQIAYSIQYYRAPNNVGGGGSSGGGGGGGGVGVGGGGRGGGGVGVGGGRITDYKITSYFCLI